MMATFPAEARNHSFLVSQFVQAAERLDAACTAQIAQQWASMGNIDANVGCSVPDKTSCTGLAIAADEGARLKRSMQGHLRDAVAHHQAAVKKVEGAALFDGFKAAGVSTTLSVSGVGQRHATASSKLVELIFAFNEMLHGCVVVAPETMCAETLLKWRSGVPKRYEPADCSPAPADHGHHQL